ncbi:MAG: GNAT family N-acetyltransferase [Oscillospiraceae bacterium]|nr:GNAT family N-acetyltransferase [Oscillospiraceae bacterium]
MRFVLREWTKKDVHSVAKHANNKSIEKNLRASFPHPYTLEDAEEYIDMCANADKTKSLCRCVDVNGGAVGSIGVFLLDDVYCKSAEIGYWLSQDYWGMGIMTKAVSEICEIAFKELDIVRIQACVFGFNKGSMKVLSKAGFDLEGILKKSIYKDGQIHDSYMYAKTR